MGLKWEFWLGNEIHCLNFATCHAELRIDMGDNTGRKTRAIYDYFGLESERTTYKLRLGAYTGTDEHAIMYVSIPIFTHMYNMIGMV